MGWLEDIGNWAFGEGSMAKGAYDWTFGEGSEINKAFQGITGETAAEAAREAAQMQVGAAEKGIEEQRRQFDVMTELLSDYVGIGKDALTGYRELVGLGTPEEQAEAIERIKQSPEYLSLIQEGEEGILSAASATGGLRGGNVQQALYQNRPQILSSLIDKQLSRFGGLSTIGQQSAARTGASGMELGRNISGLYGDIGAYQAGGKLGEAEASMDGTGNLFKLGGSIIGGLF